MESYYNHRTSPHLDHFIHSPNARSEISSDYPPSKPLDLFASDAPTYAELSSDPSFEQVNRSNISLSNVFGASDSSESCEDDSGDSRSTSCPESEDTTLSQPRNRLEASSSDPTLPASDHTTQGEPIPRHLSVRTPPPTSPPHPILTSSSSNLEVPAEVTPSVVALTPFDSDDENLIEHHPFPHTSDPLPLEELDAILRLIAFSRSEAPAAKDTPSDDDSYDDDTPEHGSWIRSASLSSGSRSPRSQSQVPSQSSKSHDHTQSSVLARKRPHDEEASTPGTNLEPDSTSFIKRIKTFHEPASIQVAHQPATNIPAKRRLSRAQYLAREPASLRRSRSLNSAKSPLVHEVQPERDSLTPPTVSKYFISHDRVTSSRESAQTPISMPPPSTTLVIATHRLRRLMDRETEHRRSDDLPPSLLGHVHLPIEGTAVQDWGCLSTVLRRDVIQWMFEAMPRERSRKSHQVTSFDQGLEYMDSFANLKNHLETSTETRALAVLLFTRYFHRKGPSWYTKLGLSSHPAGEFCRISPDDSDDETDPCYENDEDNGLTKMYGNVMWERLAWDIALACLCISVKFYHDFLYPLYPIFLPEFRRLSASGIDEDELELTQKEVLRTFKYAIYEPTPQAYFQELEVALPALMGLVNDLDIDSPWVSVKSRVWEVIKEVATEPDFIRFSTSLITCAAILDAIVAFLIEDYAKESTAQLNSSLARTKTTRTPLKPVNLDQDDRSRDHPAFRQQRTERKAVRDWAEQDVEGVRDEILKLFDFDEDDLASCRDWICMVSSH